MRAINSLGILAAASLALLVGCSGGDVFKASPTPAPDASQSGDAPTGIPGGMRMILSSPSLNSGVAQVADPTDPVEAVTITVIVTDSGGVTVANQPVQFSLPNRDATLQIIDAVTDASGAARAFITTGGDVTNRVVKVNAVAGEVSESIDVNIEGTSITLAGPPSLGLDSEASYSVRLSDGRGQESATSGGIADETVSVSLVAGTELTILDDSNLTTDRNGVVNFDVRADAPTVNSPVTLQVSALGEAATIDVTVSESSLIIDQTKSRLSLGETLTISATLNDRTLPAAGQELTFATTRGSLSVSKRITDANGKASVDYTASGGSGPALIRVYGPNGAVADKLLQLVSINPFRVDLQTDPGTLAVNDTTVLTAVVRDPDGNLVEDKIVEFDLQDPTGGSLSAPRGTTDAQGRVSVTYTANSAPSANRGVVVRAYTPGAYDPSRGIYCNDSVDLGGVEDGDAENNDGNGAGEDTNLLCDQFALTVGGFALRVALGTGNTIVEPDTTTYRMPWSALVTDSRGNPAPPGTSLRLKVLPVAYQKGTSFFDDPLWLRDYSIQDPGEVPKPPEADDGDGEQGQAGEGASQQVARDTSFGLGCSAEDKNQNGVLDPSEDTSGDGTLTPSNVVSVPQGTGAGEDLVPLSQEGFAFFDLAYAQDMADWVRVKLVAIASVDGSETVESRTFILPGSVEDFNKEDTPPPGFNSPFGTSSVCTDSL